MRGYDSYGHMVHLSEALMLIETVVEMHRSRCQYSRIHLHLALHLNRIEKSLQTDLLPTPSIHLESHRPPTGSGPFHLDLAFLAR